MTATAAPADLVTEPVASGRIGAVALTVALSALDGFDVLSVTFAAPAITRGWGIDKLALGAVLSSGLAGMAVGSFALAPLADLIGRKRMVLVSLILMTIGSFLSAHAGGVGELAAWRICTGLGIGACVAVIAPLSAEYAGPRWRSLAVAMMAMGYPAGGLIGGLLSAALLRWAGWQAIFATGAAIGLVMIALVAFCLPESPAFRREATGPRGYAGVFARDRLGSTARLAAVNMLVAAVVYYVLSWLPQLVADAGFSPAQGSMVSAVLSLFGIVGCLVIGAVAHRRAPERPTAVMVVLLGVTLFGFGMLPASLTAIVAGAAILGFLILASSAGFYAVLARGFDDASRVSGSGFVIATGRVSSAIAPLVAGWLFALDLDRAWVSLVFGACALVASMVLFVHRSPEGLA